MKLLIIGCGSIGCRHARVASELGDYEIALCDAIPASLQRIAGELGIQETYTDMDAAIRLSGADAAIVCTPNHLHAAPTIAALKAGMDVLCEKPIATSLEDASAMVAAARESGRKLMVGYTLRATLGVQKVKELLDSGRLGKIVSARVVLDAPETLTCARTPFRAKYETGGGVMYDYTHQLDFCGYFFGPARSCFARVDSRLPYLATCDDSAEGIVDYDGLTVNYHWDYVQWTVKNRNYVSIIGEKGVIEFFYKGSLSVSFYDGSSETYELADDHERNNSFKRQLGMFAQYCREGACKGVCTGENALADLRLASALYESNRQRRMIDL